jgi:hypothetical protein
MPHGCWRLHCHMLMVAGHFTVPGLLPRVAGHFTVTCPGCWGFRCHMPRLLGVSLSHAQVAGVFAVTCPGCWGFRCQMHMPQGSWCCQLTVDRDIFSQHPQKEKRPDGRGLPRADVNVISRYWGTVRTYTSIGMRLTGLFMGCTGV